MKTQHQHELSRPTNFNPSVMVLAMLGLGLVAFFVLFRGTLDASSGFLILLLLACPLMHLFMHGGHRGH